MSLSALQHLVSPLVKPSTFDFWAGAINPLWTWERPLARIVDRQMASSDAITLTLKPNRHFQGFLPGQHIPVTVDVNGRRMTRTYSPTSLPQPDGLLSITVREVVGGAVSPYLCRHSKVGDVLELGLAFGGMTLSPVRQTQKNLFLAAGSGITPLISLTRQLTDAGMPSDVTLMYWAKKREEFCFAQELRELAAKHPSFRVIFILTQQEDCLPEEAQGRLSAELLAKYVPDFRDHHVAGCGPQGFVEIAEALTKEALSFQAETFTPPTFGTDATGVVQVHLAVSNRTLEISKGESLLQALEAQGVQPEYGCRMGICNTCACAKSSGTTQDMTNGEINAEAASALRLCISRATSDVTIDL